MTASWKSSGCRTAISIFAILCFFILLSDPSHGRTIVKRTGPCSVLITIKIEVFGPSATQAVADKWKKNIERQWNGATRSTIEAIALAEGIISTIDETATKADQAKAKSENNNKLRKNRDKLNKKYQEMMKDLGLGTGSTMVNCCTITFVADVKLRGDKATSDYHQIKAVPSYQNKVIDGKTERTRMRSFVRKEKVNGKWVSNGQNKSTSGQWRADDTSDQTPEAHETGHLMGLGDKYHKGKDGYSEDDPGHEADLMSNNNAWPHESGLGEILTKAGIKCNCCPTDIDSYYQKFTITALAAGDAILACNREVLNQSLQDLKDQMHNMALARLPMTAKTDLYHKLKDKMEKVKKAIKKCGKPYRPVTGLGLDDFDLGKLGYGLASDSTEFCTYTSGNESGPIEPPTLTLDDPDQPVSTPGSTPAPTPGSTPAPKPHPTPENTPGSAPATAIPHAISLSDLDLTPGTMTPWYIFNPEDTPKETPDTTSTPPEDKPDPAVPTINYHIKAKDSVLQADGTKLSQNIGGQRIKLIDPALKNPALAMNDNNKNDTGFKLDPNQCTTDDNGDCTIKIPVQDLIDAIGSKTPIDPNAVGIPGKIEIEVTGNKIKSYNMIVPKSEVAALPEDVTRKAASSLTIGKFTYLTYNLDYNSGLDYKYNGKFSLGLKYETEVNICADEQPGPPMGTFVDKIHTVRENHIPGATIILDRGAMP